MTTDFLTGKFQKQESEERRCRPHCLRLELPGLRQRVGERENEVSRELLLPSISLCPQLLCSASGT